MLKKREYFLGPSKHFFLYKKSLQVEKPYDDIQGVQLKRGPITPLLFKC